MAAIAVLTRELSSYGAFKRETGTFVHDTSADQVLETKLSSIIACHFQCITAAAGREVIIAYNTNTTTDNAVGKSGFINLNADDGTPANDMSNSHTYMYEAIGRG